MPAQNNHGIVRCREKYQRQQFYTGISTCYTGWQFCNCFRYSEWFFSFSSTGNFTDTGLVSIKLAASATRAAADTSAFTIRYKTSDCTINVPVTSATPQAIYTLLGAPDTCTPVTVSGGYIKDVSLGADDIVTISLQATAPGSYSISTNEINGYKFFASSTVVAGIQTIKLKSIGAPLAKGTDHFTVTAGGSSCTFTVMVYDPVIVRGTDYFPLV
ncbi:MAG: hypothetical protein H7320_14815 [Ferruginibacter sp.]|nr:hypothetical protein [Ferruginibacter sp.]